MRRCGISALNTARRQHSNWGEHCPCCCPGLRAPHLHVERCAGTAATDRCSDSLLPSVAAIGRAGGIDFIRLPNRTMRGAPVATRHEAGIAAWQPTWVCMGCAQSEQLGDLFIPAEAGSPCDRCGSILQWEYAFSSGTEAFGCPQRCARPAPSAAAPPPQPLAGTPDPDEPPPNPRQPEPPNLHPARSHHADMRFPEAHLELQSRRTWYDQGPPEHDVQPPTNSWLYVPLLHGALGALSDWAIAMWRAEARAAPHWEEARRAVAVSVPVPVAALTEALIAAASHRN